MINEHEVRDAFKKAKNDIDGLKAEISVIKGVLEEIKVELRPIKATPKLEHIPLPKEDSHSSSIGNQGVANSQRQPTDDRPPTINDNRQRQPTVPGLIELKESLNSAFRRLTNREFSVFMAIYELDKEKGGYITYSELSLRLNISESTVRDFVNQLVRKNIPIDKCRDFNNKVSLSIKNEFKRLNLYQNLLKLKTIRSGQRTLFDI